MSLQVMLVGANLWHMPRMVSTSVLVEVMMRAIGLACPARHGCSKRCIMIATTLSSVLPSPAAAQATRLWPRRTTGNPWA